MAIALTRIILYVHDVERLSAFYGETFALPLVEAIGDEWAVLKSGGSELALHRVGEPWRAETPGAHSMSNAKLVFAVDDVTAMRTRLIAKGMQMGEVKSYAGTGLLCDGRDPDGNVFQLAERSSHAL